MKIVLFEGAEFELLYPLTYLRPVFELRCGTSSLREKIERKFPEARLHLETREIMARVAAEVSGKPVNDATRLEADDDMLLVRAGAVLRGKPSDYTATETVALNEDGEFVWAFIKRATAAELHAASAGELAEAAAHKLPSRTTQDPLIRYPWDLINLNPSEIERDFREAFGPALEGTLHDGAAVLGDRKNLHLAAGAEVEPLAFIDCREGPVIIDTDAVVHAHTSIHAPAYIGRDSRLFEAKIREGTSIGPVCRVGGEVEESIIHGYSNKYHTGFLGHSYVCEWVNLGALTTNSDLKNDYTSVTVYLNGKPTDTGSMKVGAFIGDHTKTGIGTLLNTGSWIGIMCNLVPGASVLPKYIPSFCWYLGSRISKGLGLNQALKTARAAMERRGVHLTDAMEELIRYTEKLTRAEKLEKVKRDRKKASR